MNPPDPHFLEVDSIRTAHLVAHPPQETDTTVLALHGWGAHSGLMWPIAERLAPLGYHAFAPDLPGFGQSALPPATWGVSDYVKFVLAYMDANDINHAYLIGHSFGGRLGLVLGAEHSDRIRKMALADAAGVPSRPSLLTRTRLTVYKGLRDTLYKVGARSTADQLRQWYSSRYGSADFKSAGALRETFVRVVNEDLLPYAARVSCPTLLFWGDQDEDTPLWQGKLLEKTIPDAGLVVYPGAGHYSYLEHLGEFISVVDYFFRY
jgi:pimeloyl-ACP methyl ester carboxylesterase